MFDQQSDGNGYEILLHFYILCYGIKLATAFVKWDLPKLSTDCPLVYYKSLEIALTDH